MNSSDRKCNYFLQLFSNEKDLYHSLCITAPEITMETRKLIEKTMEEEVKKKEEKEKEKVIRGKSIKKN